MHAKNSSIVIQLSRSQIVYDYGADDLPPGFEPQAQSSSMGHNGAHQQVLQSCVLGRQIEFVYYSILWVWVVILLFIRDLNTCAILQEEDYMDRRGPGRLVDTKEEIRAEPAGNTPYTSAVSFEELNLSKELLEASLRQSMSFYSKRPCHILCCVGMAFQLSR